MNKEGLDSNETRGKKRKPAVLLHVDDDPNDVELLKAAARKAGAQFVLKSAPNHEEAIGYLNHVYRTERLEGEEMPSVILLDVNLPKAKGPELLQWMQSHPDLKRIPVIVLSGSESQCDMQKAFAAGAASYHVKPLEFQSLVALVSQINSQWGNPGAVARAAI